MPKVSVITALYNGERYIEEAAKSVLRQTYQDFEYFVIDDGSTDGSKAKVLALGDRIRYVYQQNQGAVGAVNHGVRLAKGEYVAFCDQDDYLLPHRLERQVAFMDAHPECDMVYSDAFVCDAEGKRFPKTWTQALNVRPRAGGYRECAAELFRRNFICSTPTAMIRKSVFEAIGPFAAASASSYDYDFWFRMLEHGSRFGFIDEPLAVYRIHAAQKSNQVRTAKKLLIKILSGFLARKPSFIAEHPFLVIEKFARSSAALLFNRTETVTYGTQ